MTFQNEKTSSKAWCLIYRYRRKRRRQKGGFFSNRCIGSSYIRDTRWARYKKLLGGKRLKRIRYV